MSDRVEMTLVGLYVAGWFIDWTYWIAVGWEFAGIEGVPDHGLPTMFGWIPAFFWPLHAGSEVWKMIIQ